MRIKLDENLPVCLVETLSRRGHDVDTVPQEGIQGFVDADVWEAAQRAERFFITQDLDFSDMRNFAPNTHYGILLVRLAHPNRRVLAAFIEALFQQPDVHTWERCFVVATETKIRVRRV